MGLDPVEFDPDPDDVRRVEVGLFRRLRERPREAFLQADEIVGRILPREKPVLRIKQNALSA